MPKELKKILTYAVVAIAVIWIGGCIIKRQRPVYVKWKLKRALEAVEPWTASTNYSAEGWTRLVRAAKTLQKTDPVLAGDALGEFMKAGGVTPELLATKQAKAFLVFRTAFDLSEHAPEGKKFSFADWVRARTDVNADGTVNLAWPLSFEAGPPRLVAGREGSPGTYSARDEYDFIRYKFTPRDLSRIQVSNR
jgi:hypothetical protein